MNESNEIFRKVLKRLLVALDLADGGIKRLQSAGGLASSLEIELGALYIEDEALHRVAEFPFAEEILLCSGVARPLQPGVLNRGFRAHARRMERMVGQVASELGLKSSFSTGRGSPMNAAIEALREDDLLIVGGSGATPWGQSVVARGHTNPLAVVFDSSRKAMLSLSVAAQLARATRRSLLVLTTASEAAMAASFQRQAAETLAHTGVQARYDTITPGGDFMLLVDRAVRACASLLVLDADDERLRCLDMRELSRAPCGLALVN